MVTKSRLLHCLQKGAPCHFLRGVASMPVAKSLEEHFLNIVWVALKQRLHLCIGYAQVRANGAPLLAGHRTHMTSKVYLAWLRPQEHCSGRKGTWYLVLKTTHTRTHTTQNATNTKIPWKSVISLVPSPLPATILQWPEKVVWRLWSTFLHGPRSPFPAGMRACQSDYTTAH